MLRETEEVELAGTLDENAIGSLVNLVRDCNVTLRWILLHTTSLNLSKRSRSFQQLVITESKYTEINCLRLLLNTAQIEQDVKQTYKEVNELFNISDTLRNIVTYLCKIFFSQICTSNNYFYY